MGFPRGVGYIATAFFGAIAKAFSSAFAQGSARKTIPPPPPKATSSIRFLSSTKSNSCKVVIVHMFCARAFPHRDTPNGPGYRLGNRVAITTEYGLRI